MTNQNAKTITNWCTIYSTHSAAAYLAMIVVAKASTKKSVDFSDVTGNATKTSVQTVSSKNWTWTKKTRIRWCLSSSMLSTLTVQILISSILTTKNLSVKPNSDTWFAMDVTKRIFRMKYSTDVKTTVIRICAILAKTKN